MKFSLPTAEIFVPDDLPAEPALAREDWPAAETLAREALPLSEAVHRQQLIANNNRRLAKALVRQGKAAEALPHARRAVEACPRLGRALARAPRRVGEGNAFLAQPHASKTVVAPTWLKRRRDPGGSGGAAGPTGVGLIAKRTTAKNEAFIESRIRLSLHEHSWAGDPFGAPPGGV